jgi:hypothetical protein
VDAPLDRSVLQVADAVHRLRVDRVVVGALRECDASAGEEVPHAGGPGLAVDMQVVVIAGVKLDEGLPGLC